MDITVRWELQFRAKHKDDVSAAFEKVRNKAMDLPFEGVGTVVEIPPEMWENDYKDLSDGFSWAIHAPGCCEEDQVRIMAKPMHTFSLMIQPGDCCGEMLLVLTLPNFTSVRDELSEKGVEVSLIELNESNIGGWSSHGFCKTVFATDSVRCHKNVCELLRFMEESTDVRVGVSDDADYYGKWDLDNLVETLKKKENGRV